MVIVSWVNIVGKQMCFSMLCFLHHTTLGTRGQLPFSFHRSDHNSVCAIHTHSARGEGPGARFLDPLSFSHFCEFIDDFIENNFSMNKFLKSQINV